MRKTVFCFVLFLVLLLNFSLPCSAVEVNGKEVFIGDTVKYEIHASGCPKNVAGLNIHIYYDSTALEYVPDSLVISNIRGYVSNDGMDGEIRFNAVDLQGFELQGDKVIAEMQFRVVSGYNPYPNLSYEVLNFIDIDDEEFYDSYTFALTTINGEEQELSTETVSEISEDTDTSSQNNSATESREADSKVQSKPENSDSESREVYSDWQSAVTANDKSSNVSNATLDAAQSADFEKPAASNDDNNFSMKIVICFAVVFVILSVIIAFAALKSKSNGRHMSND